MNFQIKLENFNELFFLLHIDKIVTSQFIKNKVINLFKNLKDEISINHKNDEIINLDVQYYKDKIGIKFPSDYFEHIFSIYSSILNTEVNFYNIAEHLELSKILNYT